MSEELMMIKSFNEQISNFFSVMFDAVSMDLQKDINLDEISENEIKILFSKNVKLPKRTIHSIYLAAVKHEYADVIERLYQDFMTNDIIKRFFFRSL